MANVNSWVEITSAIGTAAAAGIALWLGLRDGWRRKRQADQRAKLAVASLAPRILWTIDRIADARAIIVFWDVYDDLAPVRMYGMAVDEMRRAHSKILLDNLADLLPVSDECAYRFARGLAMIPVIIDEMIASADLFGADRYDVEKANKQRFRLSERLSEPHDLLRAAWSDCQKMSSIVVRPLTDEELGFVPSAGHQD